MLLEAANRLVAERLLLAEDGDRLVAAARESWDVYQALKEPIWKPSGLVSVSGHDRSQTLQSREASSPTRCRANDFA